MNPHINRYNNARDAFEALTENSDAFYTTQTKINYEFATRQILTAHKTH